MAADFLSVQFIGPIATMSECDLIVSHQAYGREPFPDPCSEGYDAAYWPSKGSRQCLGGFLYGARRIPILL